jgi:methylated-DNA-[protein]-cysteine S-methyltransferase
MAKSAADHPKNADASFDAVLRLGEVAPHAPANLRDGIDLGLRLDPEGRALAELVFLTNPAPARAIHANVCGRYEPLLEVIGHQLRAWFANPAYAFSLPLGQAPTPFQERLRTALCKIQSGETHTYAELAQQLHSAPRAVGQALGSNPLPLIVPCHRIISAGQNRLTGFNHARNGPMLTLKAWLLDREARA